MISLYIVSTRWLVTSKTIQYSKRIMKKFFERVGEIIFVVTYRNIGPVAPLAIIAMALFLYVIYVRR